MKKLIIAILLLILSHYSYSQWFLGYSEDEIIQASQKTGGIKQRKLTDANNNLHVLWDILDPFTTFDAIIQDGLATSVFLIPQNQRSRDSWYAVITRDYYMVSQGTWKGYQNSQEFYIQYFKMGDGMMVYRISKTMKD